MTTDPRAAFEATLKKYYAALGSGKKAEVLKLIAPNVVHIFNHAASEVGIVAFEKFLDLKGSMYEEAFDDLRIYTDASGRQGAAQFQLNGIYKKTYPGLPEAKGQKYSITVGAFLETEKGLITKITTLFDFEEWLRQISN